MRLGRLLDFLFPLRSDESLVRETSTEGLLKLLAPTIVPDTRPGTVALLSFHAPAVRAALHEAKYHGSEKAFELLAAILREYLSGDDTLWSEKVMVVPVPLGPLRLKERGFNQVEEVVRRAITGLPLEMDSGLLVRTRETKSQVSLPRIEREKNMKNAFAAPKRAEAGYLYIVVDDVVTTGATLQAALEALRASGALTIQAIALAH
jgi:predicted amidophosphoribosyltransferase